MVTTQGLVSHLIKHKRETFYTMMMFLMMEMALVAYEVRAPGLFMFSGLTALWSAFAWSLFTYMEYGERKVSKHAGFSLWINMAERVFPYFIMPMLLIASAFAYLYLNKHPILRQVIVMLTTVYLWSILVHIKDSYKQHHSVTGMTRVMFKFVDLLVFYLTVSTLYLLPIAVTTKIISMIAVAAVLLMHQLRLYNQRTVKGYLIYAASVVVIAISGWLAIGLSPLVAPLIITIAFYMIMSLWYMKLSGYTRLEELLTPVLFALMALLVVLSF